MDYDLDYDDLYGFDDDDDDEIDDEIDDLLGWNDDDLLGALWGRRGKRRKRRRPGRRRPSRRPRRPRRPRTLALSARPGSPRVLPRPPLISPAPGVPQASALYIPLGLGVNIFTDTSPTSFTFREKPEKPVRPRRLWISTAKTAGAAGILVSVTDIKIGVVSMMAGLSPIPAEQFSPQAFAREYNMFQSAEPGISVAVFLALSAAPGVGETVTASVSVDCESLG